ncbi:MAG: hypothetical protein ACR2KQ_00760 [Actinomycetota bacterium]
MGSLFGFLTALAGLGGIVIGFLLWMIHNDLPESGFRIKLTAVAAWLVGVALLAAGARVWYRSKQ